MADTDNPPSADEFDFYKNIYKALPPRALKKLEAEDMRPTDENSPLPISMSARRASLCM